MSDYIHIHTYIHTHAYIFGCIHTCIIKLQHTREILLLAGSTDVPWWLHLLLFSPSSLPPSRPGHLLSQDGVAGNANPTLTITDGLPMSASRLLMRQALNHYFINYFYRWSSSLSAWWVHAAWWRVINYLSSTWLCPGIRVPDPAMTPKHGPPPCKD